MRVDSGRAIVVLLVVAALRLTSAQTAQTSPARAAGTGLIAGSIVDAGTGRAVAGAMAILRGLKIVGSPSGDFEIKTIIADADGRFVFRDLPAGTFLLEVTATGYPQGAFGRTRANGEPQTIELAGGARLTDVTISLWKHGAISGTVLDETGAPVVEVRVNAQRRSLVAGRYRLAPAGQTVSTDDRGVYRIPALQAGEYVITVPSVQTTIPTSVLDAIQKVQSLGVEPSTVSGLPLSGQSNFIRVGDLQLLTAGTSGRLPIAPQPSGAGPLNIYPSVTSAPVTITAGEEKQGVDLQLRLVPSFRVSGLVMGVDGAAANVAVKLVTNPAPGSATSDLTAGNAADVAVTSTDADGAFTFLGVPSGVYTIIVRKGSAVSPYARNTGPDLNPAEPFFWADQPVGVAETDVRDVRVMLRQALRVSGRIEFDGAAPRPSPDRLRSIPVMIERADAGPGDFGGRPGIVDANGHFDTVGFTPGKYFVRIGGSPAGWALKSAMFDGRDVSDKPLEIEGTDISGIVVTYTDRPVEVRGTVRDAAGLPDASAGVVIFATDRSAWMDYGLNPRRLFIAKADRNGAYGMASYPSLPAGEYFIVAVTDAQLGSWRDPDFLDKLTHVATRITLSEGDHKAIDLKTTEVR